MVIALKRRQLILQTMFEDVKFGYQLPPYVIELMMDTALYVEKNGFDSIFMGDHLVGIGIKRFDFLEAWSVLSALALKTKRVMLGAFTDPHRRHPAVLAQTVTTLDHLSNGRAILGIGAGEGMNLIPYNIPWNKPVSRLYEAIKVIKGLWTENKADFKGDFYKLEKAFLDPKSVKKPHPPIWVTANSPRTIRMTAEFGDGWVPTPPPLTIEGYKENLNRLSGWAKEFGRDPKAIEPGVFHFIVVAKDHDNARQLIELPGKMILALWSGLIDKHVKLKGPVLREFQINRFVFNQESAPKLIRYADETIPQEAIDKFFIYGSPDECIDKIEGYLRAGVKHFIAGMFVPSRLVKETLRLYVEDVVSYFRDS